MQHLWTAATTTDTVTHDAGEPEWLDLPITGYTFAPILTKMSSRKKS